MPEYIVEYVVTQVRFVRITANDSITASQEVAQYHAQHDSEALHETVIILKTEEDN